MIEMAAKAETIGQCVEAVRSKRPLIQNITNYVTVNDVANILLASGASPIMSDEPEDAREIAEIAQGLTLNIGTLNEQIMRTMLEAGKVANRKNSPIVLDPVGAGASSPRNRAVATLLNQLKLDVIRGNSSEIRALMHGSHSTRGVDCDVADVIDERNLDESVRQVKQYAAATGSIIAISGAIDLVSDAERCYVIYNGMPQMCSVTGTGCQLTALITAFIAANPEQKLEAAAAAVIDMGLSGQIAYGHLQEYEGNSTYRNRIIDAIYRMDGATLCEGARYEIR